MSSIAKDIGKRLRSKRQELGYTQEYTAEKANLHPTYIGQIERGEKNITIESLEKICIALKYPMEELFSKIMDLNPKDSVANECYSLIMSQSEHDQRMLLRLLKYMIDFKSL